MLESERGRRERRPTSRRSSVSGGRRGASSSRAGLRRAGRRRLGRRAPGTPPAPGARGAAAGVGASPAAGRRSGRLLQDDVGVGAADPERRHAGPARAAGRAGQATGLGEQPHRAGRSSRHAAVGASTCRVARQHAVPHAPCTILMTPADAGGGLGVADVGLERAEPQRPFGGPVLAVGGQQRLRLDRVAERGAGAVRLDDVHVGRRTARRWPAPAGSPAAGRGRWARSARCSRRPG